jgi:hypothetical protein
MPDLVLEYHRLKTPIDHPDQSVTRAKLEVPVSGASFAYLACVNRVRGCAWINASYFLLADWVFTDKSVFAFEQVNQITGIVGRLSDYSRFYRHAFDPAQSTKDHYIDVRTGGTSGTLLASEAIDIDNSGRGGRLSISGSVIKGMRYEMPTPVHPLSLPPPDAIISATDTTYASGYYGARVLRHTTYHSSTDPASMWLLDPASELPPALAIVEVEYVVEYVKDSVEGAPARPLLSENPVEISGRALPPHLHAEAKKYEVLRAKGFTEEEIRLVFGYVPQHQIDLDAVTWGAFEFSEKSPTNIIVVTGDNPYRPGAIERQKARAKRWWRPPRDYSEAVKLYAQLKRDYPHWLAGKHNWCYQIFGYELFDWLQNVDFYYGELVEHRTHYQQLKQVPEGEIWRRLDALESALRGAAGLAGALAAERDRHLAKIREIRRHGW